MPRIPAGRKVSSLPPRLWAGEQLSWCKWHPVEGSRVFAVPRGQEVRRVRGYERAGPRDALALLCPLAAMLLTWWFKGKGNLRS